VYILKLLYVSNAYRGGVFVVCYKLVSYKWTYDRASLIAGVGPSVKDGLLVMHRRSPIQVLTGSNVTQLRWSRPSVTTKPNRQTDVRPVRESKVKEMWICIAHRRQHASIALPLPVLTPVKLVHSARQTPANAARSWIRAMCVSCNVPVYSPSFAGNSYCWHREEWLRLSRPACLVLRRGGLPVQRWSPI